MTLDLRESRLRQRRRRRLAAIKWIFLLLLFVALGFWAYDSGSALAEQEVGMLRDEIGRLTRSVAELKQERDGLLVQMQAARNREKEWEQRYAQDVPTGEAKRIFALIQDRLRAGVAPERVAFVLRMVENKDRCDGKPSTKRFILPTPTSEGGNDSVAFADGAIRVTGQGEPASDGRGGLQAWFDPAKPVSIRFTSLGGKNSEVSGKLPLYHSIVRGDSEYRFTIAAGDRSFVTVTGDRCAYP